MDGTNPYPGGDARAAELSPDDSDPRLLRALADLDNVRKRYERRLADAAFDEQSRVLSLWLPVVDDLERALEYAGDDTQMIAGVRSVYEHALAILARLGVTRFADVGEQFDPVRHEAVGTLDTAAAPGEIVAVAQPGYLRDGVTMRPARVVVTRPLDGAPADNGSHDHPHDRSQDRSHDEESRAGENTHEQKPG
jgi:molecular chaperone GrpE